MDYTKMNNNILLIDDDPDDHEIFEFALELAYPTATCEHSYNCQDAVEKIRKRSSPLPGNIFLDFNMPMMELPKCLFAINEALGVDHADIVILTGFRTDDLPDFNSFGVVKVISKPSTIELLAEEIQDVVGYWASA
ncbi:response regulator [Dyadobacter chenwenxiniae]|uniref:Response regulator n=1 Tax=Dyadobacter chenwenxiniae TaxID=2906456 RepID=A0A9X1TED4_9BACT|nr:response regulator [Dyadobacter chenwenxiniae]MCF0062876.1 response regulator [Dyadobacter chenwenxiniae]UON84949.1 response regulator [Dyadobacter chenwenxiniae]